ncbi:MAG TPA: hypothetical protein VH372_17135 [Actinospica sp.]|nr:hypothetical protein [Actinospica sp.]
MATELQLAARPRGNLSTVLAFGTALAAAAVCLAGCSNGAGSESGTLFNTAQTAGPSASTSGSASEPGSESGSLSASARQSATAAPPEADASVSVPSASTSSTSAGTAIPTAAWIAPSAIPLDGTYRWTAPSSRARAAKAPVLSAVRDCRLTLGGDDKAELGAFPAARAELKPTAGTTGGQDDWSAQETILATADTSSGEVQGIYGLYVGLVAAVERCAATAPNAKLTAATSQGSTYAATITIPTSTGRTLTWHEYLAAPYGYLVELSLWVAPYAGGKPSAGWDGTSAPTVLSALQSGPCSLTRLC